MKVCIDGIYRDATEEEEKQASIDKRKAEVYNKYRPLTTEEVSQLFFREQVNNLTIDDETSLKMIDYYPLWEDLIGREGVIGFKFVYKGKLYKVLQTHTFSSSWVPDTGTESLYTRIDEEHNGDLYDPIPYEGNMSLVNGKYYTQNGVTYLCNRDAGVPVYHPLKDLVDIYVTVVNTENI